VTRTRQPLRTVKVLFFALLAIALAGCTADWATWGNGTLRDSENSLETAIGTSNVASLTQKWSVNLGAYGNASPILVHGVNINGTATDVLYVGTEHGAFFAISTAGTPLWLRGLGSRTIACPDTPDQVYGISAPAVYDKTGNRLFVAGGDGFVYALNPSTGATLPGWPVRLTSDPVHEVVFSAPTYLNGHLYFEIASHCDITPYHGRIVDISPSTHAIAHTFYVTGSATGPNGGGIWGWGGASVDPADGDVYAASGNSFTSPENLPNADSVLRLSSNLALKAADAPLVSMVDDDFGSTPVLFQKSGCPKQLVAMQKNGSLYLYDTDSIASGYRQRILIAQPWLIGVAAYSAKTGYIYVATQSDSADAVYKRGVIAFRINANCMLQKVWDTNVVLTGSTAPVVANGVVYVPGGRANKLFAFNASTGAALWNSGSTITSDIYAQPIVLDGHVYAVAYDHKLHAYGL
jgi:outer membrane protein assembly factor BamB